MRHLCAAYPVLANWHLKDFERFEIDRLQWARAYGAEMARRFPAERAYWASYADRASPVPLTSFSADVYTDEDLLGIDRSVDALALLIASTRTVTPLAFGVFGPWGSGKSFFMRHLQKRIVRIRDDEQARIDAWIAKRAARTAQPEDAPLYFGQVAQVEFNAWHYNEGNLVASLVEHLFRNLRISPTESDQELAQRRADMLRQLKVLNSDLKTVDETISTAQANLSQAKADVERASQQAEAARQDVKGRAQVIEEQKAALLEEHRKLDAALQAVALKPGEVDPSAIVSVALGPLNTLFGEIRGTLNTLRARIFDWKAFFARVATPEGFVILSLCVAAPFVLKFAVALQTQWAALTGIGALALASLKNAIDVLKQYRAQFEQKMQELEAAEREHENDARRAIDIRRTEVARELSERTNALQAQRAALAEREDALRVAAQELALRAREHDAKLAERVAAEKKVRLAEAELERLSSALLLEEFIKDRSSTDEYRKQLGFLALVRRDIERLSTLIDSANRRWLETDNQDPPPLLNRIILYIDDLDRCQEKTVLAVLEAVHLLLAFPLFVCAVAVDPRWVAKCLREAHKQLLPDESPTGKEATATSFATVGDYLEKIFQIPIWMSPIAERTRAALVNSLLGPTAAPSPRRPGVGQGGVIQTDPAFIPLAAPGAFNELVAKARKLPDPLRISPEEAAFVEQIASLLSDRPRALKRFVNIYRLLKASLPDIERASFVTDDMSSPHRICLSQLALFTGHQAIAPLVVAQFQPTSAATVVTAGPGPLASTVTDWIGMLTPQVQQELATALSPIPDLALVSLEEFRRWLPFTSRYVFYRAE